MPSPQFGERARVRGDAIQKSIDLGARFLDHFRPLGNLAPDELGELLGRARNEVDPLRHEALLHFGQGNDTSNFLAPLRHYDAWQLRGTKYSVPRRNVVT